MPKNKKIARAVVSNKPVVRKQMISDTPVKQAPAETKPAQKTCKYCLSVYIYWLIILFFICATFYILGRSQEILKRGVDGTGVISQVSDDSTLPSAQLADVANGYMTSGKTKLLSGDTSGAISDLSMAIDAVGTFSDAYLYRGEAYMQMSDYQNALTDLSRAIELSGNSIAFYDRGILNMRLDNYDAAMEDFSNALAHYQNSPSDVLSAHDIYAKRATLHLWAKKWDGAIKNFSAAISLNAENYEDYAGRAEANTGLKQYKEALDDYMTAVKVISEKIQSASSNADKEYMSRAAVSYFEKSAAIRVHLNDSEGAKSDLASARTIAAALNDSDMIARLDGLLGELE